MIKWAYLCNDMNEKIESWGIYTNGGSLFSKMITTKRNIFRKRWFRGRNKCGTRNWDVKSPPFSMGFVNWEDQDSRLLLRWDGPRTHMLGTDPSLQRVKRRDLHRSDSIRKTLASLNCPCGRWVRGFTENGFCWPSLPSLACSSDLMLRLSAIGWRGKKRTCIVIQLKLQAMPASPQGACLPASLAKSLTKHSFTNVTT